MRVAKEMREGRRQAQVPEEEQEAAEVTETSPMVQLQRLTAEVEDGGARSHPSC